MALNTEHLSRCIDTLASALDRLEDSENDSVDYEVFRNAVVKRFELVLETSGKLLRSVLKQYEASPRTVDDLVFKDVFRRADKHGLMTVEEIERWFAYRDNRNSTAHDYGAGFAEETLTLLPQFVADARALETMLKEQLRNGDA